MIPIEVKYIIISKLQVLNSVFSIILATLADWNTNLSTLRYLANGGGNMGAAVMAKAFNLGYGPFILPHLNDNECMRVVFYNPVITRSSLPAKVSCQGSNDVLKPASNIYTPTSYRQIEVSGWCEMIGSNLTSGKTTWIYNYIVQS